MSRQPVAYEGKEPYAFISYAHRDKELVFPLIRQLQDRGMRVWYDGGIDGGNNWDEEIGGHLLDCACVICFITETFVTRENCLDEMVSAREENKGPVIVYLDQAMLPRELRYKFIRLHTLNRKDFDSDASLIDKICSTEKLQPCRETAASMVEHKKPDRWAEELYDQGCYYEEFEEYDRAMACFRKAADQGHLGAMTRIGSYFAQEENEEEAVKWYRKAAELGDAVAQRNLGDCYDEGFGVQQDFSEALYWYRKAAKQGDGSAMLSIGHYYQQGNWVEKDEQEAARWYGKAGKMAEEKGDWFVEMNASYEVAVCFEKGIGVQKNLDNARFWYQKAADFGLLDAKTALERLK